jgi:hypothetical protein
MVMAKYSEKADKKQDAKVMKGMTAAQKAKFMKADKVMDKKPMTAKQDMKADKDVAKKIMKKSK